MAVTVYSIPNCPKCSAAKALLKRKGVSFEEADIEESPGKKQELVEKLSAIGVKAEQIGLPVLDIKGKIVQGFDRTQIEAALKEKGLLE